MKYKVAYQGDGTKEIGKKIIDELERLGGVNTRHWDGNTNYYYYIIPENNIINFSDSREVRNRNLNVIQLRKIASSNPNQKLFRLL